MTYKVWDKVYYIYFDDKFWTSFNLQVWIWIIDNVDDIYYIINNKKILYTYATNNYDELKKILLYIWWIYNNRTELITEMLNNIKKYNEQDFNKMCKLFKWSLMESIEDISYLEYKEYYVNS